MDSARATSVDVFRGITVIMMIVVNNPGSWSHIYAPLQHASWNGLLLADLVFPFFIFIVGVSVELSRHARMARSMDHSAIALHIVRRTAILFLLGLFLNGFPFWPAERVLQMRIPGVLQRIAVVYCITSFLCLKTGIRAQAAFLVALLAGYWAVCALVPVPGPGRACMEPGDNVAAWLDRLVLDGHLWKITGTWDPEGILSTVSAAGTCILGGWAGRIIISEKSDSAKTLLLAAGGIALAAAGLVWHPIFPVNKSMWTGSYVLCTAGIASIVLACIRQLADVWRISGWTGPFVAAGANSLAAFFLSSLAARCMNVIQIADNGGAVSLQSYLFGNLFTPYFDPYNASLAWALATAAVWTAVMILLYRKRIFIRL